MGHDMKATRVLSLLIPLLAMAGLAWAPSAFAEGGLPPAEVVLEAGRVDARTVQAGARVVVVHGRGERHPVSGEWTRLDTSAGWVQAVDVPVLVLARERDLRQQRISLDRIEMLVIGGSRKEKAATEPVEIAGKVEAADSEGRAVQGRKREERRARVFRKGCAGALGGVVGGLAGAVFGGGLVSGQDCPGGDEGDFCGVGQAILALALGGAAGYTVGAAVGVSVVDPHDRFTHALGGSAAGLLTGVYLTAATDTLGLTLFLGPIAMAIMMSEWSRDPPEDQRLSIRLRPHPGGGVSAAAALRF